MPAGANDRPRFSFNEEAMIQTRHIAALAIASLLCAGPAFAQAYPQPANPNDAESAPTRKAADPDAPSANSVDATGTFSVNPGLESDPALHAGAKVGPSRTDMNAEPADAVTSDAQTSLPPGASNPPAQGTEPLQK